MARLYDYLTHPHTHSWNLKKYDGDLEFVEHVDAFNQLSTPPQYISDKKKFIQIL